MSIAVFVLSVSLIVSRRLEESHAALLGASILLLLGVMDLYKAFEHYVDWNIVSILLGMWMISYFMSDSGLVEYMTHKILSRIGSVFTVSLVVNILAGITTMFVDNVLVVLLFVPLIVRVLMSTGLDPVKTAITVALSANFMGTALLLGDLPPQLLHVIFGAEFRDFIWMMGRPAAFPILLASFIPTVYITLWVLQRGSVSGTRLSLSREEGRVYDKTYMAVAAASFVVAIVLMSLRKEISGLLGYEIRLGVFPLVVATVTGVVLVAMKKVSFERVVEEGIDLNAVLFYIALFILVGSLEETGVLERLAETLSPLVLAPVIGYIVLYWVSAAIVAFVEHDAYILLMLKTLKYLYTEGILRDPWPLNWALLFSGTLGSNYTAAGAPALYVAFRIIERETNKRISPREIYSTTVLYSTVSLVICFVISYLVWGS